MSVGDPNEFAKGPKRSAAGTFPSQAITRDSRDPAVTFDSIVSSISATALLLEEPAQAA
jgi:hypothetical protein